MRLKQFSCACDSDKLARSFAEASYSRKKHLHQELILLDCHVQLSDELEKVDDKLKGTLVLLDNKVLISETPRLIFCIVKVPDAAISLVVHRFYNVPDAVNNLKFGAFSQNLEVKKMNDERKAALAAQTAAEATLRRVQASQKDNDMPPLEVILAPLEAELKLARLEVCLNHDT